MKKSELKQLIQVILKEVQQYSSDDLRDMESQKRPGHLEKSLDKADYLGKDTEDGADSHEERQAYKQLTGQHPVHEDGPDEEDGVDKAERDAEYTKWAADRSSKEDERDMEPHKSPSYAERMADKADRQRDSDRDSGGEEDMMLGLTHDTGPGLDEVKGLSGMKKAATKLDNTQMGYKDKSVTSTTEPKEKTDGKKLPVVKKPATPQIVKETLLALVKEAVEEYRTKGALGAGNAARVAPVKATGLNYKKKGIAGMGRPKAGSGQGDESSDSSLTVNYVEQDGTETTLDFDFLNSTWPQARKFLEGEVMATTSDALDPMAKIGVNVYQKIEAAKEAADMGTLTPETVITLFYDAISKQLKAK